MQNNPQILSDISQLLMSVRPAAMAAIHGSAAYSAIMGSMMLYDIPEGVLVVTAVTGLPTAPARCGGASIYAMHIHEGSACSGNEQDPFADAGMHYNPQDCPHPHHAGDLPPVFAYDGHAWSMVLTDSFLIDEVIGRTVIIHAAPDDFATQPAGNSGTKMACGVIERM